MTFNISEFSARVSGSGLSKNNLFAAAIKSPASMNLPIENDLIFLCKSASIPGMDLETTSIRPQGWGKMEMFPTSFTKTNLTLTFMVDSNFAVKQYFHRWMQTIINYNDLKGPNSESNGKLPFEFDYKNNYVGEIDVVVYSEHDSSDEARTYTYKFSNAFPISIGAIETAWDNQAEIMLITVLFSYGSMSVSGMQDTEISDRQIGPYTGSATGGTGGILSGALSNISQQFFGPNSLPVNIQNTIDGFLAPINNVINRGASFISSLKRIF